MKFLSWLRSLFADNTVVCTQCGDTIARDDAREYDPYGNRWDREGKEFDYFCQPCHRQLTKYADNTIIQERAAEAAGAQTNEAFVRTYLQEANDTAAVEDDNQLRDDY